MRWSWGDVGGLALDAFLAIAMVYGIFQIGKAAWSLFNSFFGSI